MSTAVGELFGWLGEGEAFAGAVVEFVGDGVGDIPSIPMMVGAVMDAARHVETELWRRVLAVILSGISAGPPTARLPGNPPPPEALAAMFSGAPVQRH